jgi:hypothetical protein
VVSLFRRRRGSGELDESIAMRIVVQGQPHDVNYRDLCLSNTRSLQALAALLIRKGLINGDELLAEVKRMGEATKPLIESPAGPQGEGE